MKAGTVVRFTNRWDETMLMSVLAVDNDWAHCVYYGREGDTKAGWFRTEVLTEEKPTPEDTQAAVEDYVFWREAIEGVK